ncbi:MAG: carbamoyltransferase N-terminal domain-containing protein [Ferruginibacter sp.]
MYILGISAYYHDSAAAIIYNGEIIAAAQEERFTRIKHDDAFPSKAITFCLEFAGINLNEVDTITFYDKPFLKFERLIETYVGNAPRGFISFLKAIPVWTKQKLFLKKIIKEELKKIAGCDLKNIKIVFTEHHLSHAAGAYFTSPFREAAILIVDGVGEWVTTTLAIGKENSIEILKEIHYPHSVGLLYSAVTYYCGFKVNSGEYKLMGLSPYGTDINEVNRLEQIILNNFCTVHADGSIELNQHYFTFSTGLKMIDKKKWSDLLGFAPRVPETEISMQYCNLAMAIQRIINDILCKLAAHLQEITHSKNLCISGGVALNCVANKAIADLNIYSEIYVQPAAGDAGGALGCALATYHIYFEKSRLEPNPEIANNCFLGPSFTNEEVIKFANQRNVPFRFIENDDELANKVAGLLAHGNIAGWFKGRMEYGPRALGARSILADPRIADMQKKLNLKIKFRESFRPFAPAVMEERAGEYFEIKMPSPFMLFTFPVKQAYDVVDDNTASIQQKINGLRSPLPSITHVDNSARVQTVNKKDNFAFYKLLQAFYNATGCAVLINTSFNRRGEPIVCTLKDAYECFMETEMDYLVIENCLFEKKSQPLLTDKLENKHNFVLD